MSTEDKRLADKWVCQTCDIPHAVPNPYVHAKDLKAKVKRRPRRPQVVFIRKDKDGRVTGRKVL